MLAGLRKSLISSLASGGGESTRCSALGWGVRHISTKKQDVIDRSKVPQLDERDLEEKFVSGSGPGGQCVNKSINCCQLRHTPTGIVIQVHQFRELARNRKIARAIMTTRLDNLYNGEQSVEAQQRRLAQKRIAIRDADRQRRQALKEEFKRLNASSKTSPDP